LYANNTGKVLYLYVTPKLLELFNNILHTQPIQKDMKTRLVIYTHTHKREQRRRCANYRRISFLSTASKLYANIL